MANKRLRFRAGRLSECPKDLAGYHALETQIKAIVAKVLPAVVGIQIGNQPEAE